MAFAFLSPHEEMRYVLERKDIIMDNIQIFKNESFGEVRVAGTSEEPLFCAKDVATALGYSDTADAIQRHCKSGKKVFCPHGNGIGGTNMVYIPEKDVYRLIMRSNLPNAEQFQDWVCDEVLPSIRKHGIYATYTKYATLGWFDIKQEVADNGHIIYHRKITGIGRQGIINLINS